ncbi:hypothetical protein SAMN02927900_05766 [Rhizobium mongolense subsp. loessense]|uniref:Uncharacterized protein n=1 Tax=Rhizobium mongolense subsp. loessense TaxID=158890 RepID=A0A1G4TZJ6_9HYPH|nr:hypothetical protein SAMN02927900_05766 [Rhizobium mongolense subsp. loessense]
MLVKTVRPADSHLLVAAAGLFLIIGGFGLFVAPALLPHYLGASCIPKKFTALCALTTGESPPAP